MWHDDQVGPVAPPRVEEISPQQWRWWAVNYYTVYNINWDGKPYPVTTSPPGWLLQCLSSLGHLGISPPKKPSKFNLPRLHRLGIFATAVTRNTKKNPQSWSWKILVVWFCKGSNFPFLEVNLLWKNHAPNSEFLKDQRKMPQHV